MHEKSMFLLNLFTENEGLQLTSGVTEGSANHNTRNQTCLVVQALYFIYIPRCLFIELFLYPLQIWK